ncbi:MAG: cell division FtsZ family protein [Verrucomicrobiaceae bacterium]|nr:cell division FtsZ family protein [Verrucomicrobiaceae bacterium]
MVEYQRTQTPGIPAEGAPRICIVGVGGAGSNVIDRITLDRIVEATLVCMHTDVRVLSHAMAPSKVQLGVELMKGIGAGGDPDLGREAALFSREQIRQSLEGHDIIFISAGLGGGTGSGAAPVVAEIAKASGALVIVVATMPFSFEGRRRIGQAEESLELLQKRCDALILFENNRMGELILPKDGIQKAFTQADQLIAQSLRAVSTITATPGLVKLGLDDLTAALRTANGRCLFGFGEARGQNRGAEAVKKALKSPLIDQGRLLYHTETLLVHVAGGESLTLVEVEGIMKQLGKNVPDQTHILFGLAIDPKLGDSVAVTLISSLSLAQLNAHSTAAPPAEMMAPRAEVAAPTPAAITAPAPAPKREPKARSAPPLAKAPPPVEEDFLFRTEEIIREAPAAIAPEPQAAAEPAAESEEAFFDEEEPPFEAEEAFSAPVHEPEPETARIPVRTPVARELAEAVRESKTLAAVISRPAPVRPEPEPVVEDDMIVFESEEPAPVSRPAPAPAPIMAVAPAPAPVTSITPRRTIAIEQPSLGLASEEDRGRFKDTEPSLVEGEDLDVPTWKRLKMKLRR